MKIAGNITSMLKYDECEECGCCKPYLKKNFFVIEGKQDIISYELHCSHEEACGQFCREDPDNSQK